MAESFYTILTKIGQGKLANAIPLQQPVNLTTIKVGDSGGAYRNPADTDLNVVGEKWSGPINALYVDPDNPNYMIVEAVITAEIGSFYVREVGVFDQAGDMIAIGKYPETYKPELPAGAGKDLYIKFVMEVSNTAAVTLKINPATVLATRQYADGLMGTAASSRRITQSGPVLTNDTSLLVDATAGDIDLTFLSAAASTSRGIRIKRIDATANRVRLLPQPGQAIEWQSYIDIVHRGEAYHFQPDGSTNWLEMAGAQYRGSIYPQWWGAKGDGINDDTAAVSAAIAAAGSTGIVVIPKGTYLINADLIITCRLEFRGGTLEIAGGKTVTITVAPVAGLSQIFSGTGSVIFGSSYQGSVFPEWFGANIVPGTTNMRSAVQKALDAVPDFTVPVVFSGVTYLISGGGLTISKRATLRGAASGYYSSRLIFSGVAGYAISVTVPAVNFYHLWLEGDGTFDEQGGDATFSGIYFNPMGVDDVDAQIKDCYLNLFATAITVRGKNVTLHDSTIQCCRNGYKLYDGNAGGAIYGHDIQRCRFHGMGSAGVYSSLAIDFTAVTAEYLRQNIISNNEGDYIGRFFAGKGDWTTFANNVFYDARGITFDIDSQIGGTVLTGNIVIKPEVSDIDSGYPFKLAGRHMTVAHNSTLYASNSGFYLASLSDSTFTGNIVTRSAQQAAADKPYGYYIDADCVNLTFQNDVVKDPRAIPAMTYAYYLAGAANNIRIIPGSITGMVNGPVRLQTPVNGNSDLLDVNGIIERRTGPASSDAANETNLYSKYLMGYAIRPNDVITISAAGVFTGASGAKNLKLYLENTKIADLALAVAPSATRWNTHITIQMIDSGHMAVSSTTTTDVSATTTYGEYAVDMTAAKLLALTGQALVGSDSVTQTMWNIERR